MIAISTVYAEAIYTKVLRNYRLKIRLLCQLTSGIEQLAWLSHHLRTNEEQAGTHSWLEKLRGLARKFLNMHHR